VNKKARKQAEIDSTPAMVTFAVPMFKADLEEFREYCKTIEADPRTVVYGFIKAVINGQIDVMPPSNAPFTQ